MGRGESDDGELDAAWQRAVKCAAAYGDAASVEPMLEAAALAVVLELEGSLSRVPERERRAVRDAARRALLRARRGPDDDDDDAESMHVAAGLAREGLRALTGEPPATGELRAGAGAWHPPASALIAMRRGAPDGLAAASVALHVGRCAACAAALQVSSGGGAALLRAAAASAAPMLAPQSGRIVGTRDAPGAEAVVFDDASGVLLAIYASEPVPVRYVGTGVTTEDMRAGYWAGRCAPGLLRLDGTLHVGESAVPWVIVLGDAETR